MEWFRYISEDSFHYGDGTVIFPSEGIILKKLSSDDESVEFSEYDLDLIKDWMHQNISKKYGDSTYLLGSELSLYQKLKDEI